MRLRMKRQLPSEDGEWVDKRTVGSRRDRGLVCRPVVCSILEARRMAGLTEKLWTAADTTGRMSRASDTLHRPLVCPRCGFKCPHQGTLLNHMKGPDGCRGRRYQVVFDEMKAKHEIDMIDSDGRCLLSGWDHFNLDDFKLWRRYTKRSTELARTSVSPRRRHSIQA